MGPFSLEGVAKKPERAFLDPYHMEIPTLNAFLIAAAAVLTILMVPLGGELLVAAAAVAWGIAFFGMGCDALDSDDGLPVGRALLVGGILTTLVFGLLAGSLGFVLASTSISLALACVWQRERMIH